MALGSVGDYLFKFNVILMTIIDFYGTNTIHYTLYIIVNILHKYLLDTCSVYKKFPRLSRFGSMKQLFIQILHEFGFNVEENVYYFIVSEQLIC